MRHCSPRRHCTGSIASKRVPLVVLLQDCVREPPFSSYTLKDSDSSCKKDSCTKRATWQPSEHKNNKGSRLESRKSFKKENGHSNGMVCTITCLLACRYSSSCMDEPCPGPAQTSSLRNHRSLLVKGRDCWR
jgi:hypothetical protein